MSGKSSGNTPLRDDMKKIINQALKQNKMLSMTYSDKQGNITRNRVIQPIEWITSYKFKAYCHLRKDERNFVLSGIQDIQLGDVAETDPVSPRDGEVASQARKNTLAQWKAAVPQSSQIETESDESWAKNFNPEDSFNEVANKDQWQQLLRYYIECLNREYLQEYSIEQRYSGTYRFFQLGDDTDIWRFLAGNSRLSFPHTINGRKLDITEFIVDPSKDGRQLCLGFPVFQTTKGTLAPLFFVPCDVNVEEEDNRKYIRLIPEEYELSYAVLDTLQIDKEEFAAIIEEIGESLFDETADRLRAFQNAILLRLEQEDMLGHPIQRKLVDSPNLSTSVDEAVLLNTPCLFWASKNTITRRLIEELEEISNHSWDHIPQSLLHFLNNSPQEDYPEPVPLARDKSIFVTRVNDEQRRATHAASDMPITVVTGPPGTGKSQLVVNIIANAVISDKNVLFASRNNHAVDVVVARLQNDMSFHGIVRTGNRREREKSAGTIMSSLDFAANKPDSSQTSNIISQIENYKNKKAILSKRLKNLDEIRRLQTAVKRKRTDLKANLETLPPKVADQLRSDELAITYNLLDMMRQSARVLIRECDTFEQRKGQLEKALQEQIIDNPDQHAIIEDIKSFEEEWGRFGDGLRDKDYFSTIESLLRYITTWELLLDAVISRIRILEIDHETQQLEVRLSELRSTLPYDAQPGNFADTDDESQLQVLADFVRTSRHNVNNAQSAIVKRVNSESKLLNEKQPVDLQEDYQEFPDADLARLDTMTNRLQEIRSYVTEGISVQDTLIDLGHWVRKILPADIQLSNADTLDKATHTTLLQQINRLIAGIEKARKPSLSNIFGLYRGHQVQSLQGKFDAVIQAFSQFMRQENEILVGLVNGLYSLKRFLVNNFKATNFLDRTETELLQHLSDLAGITSVSRSSSVDTIKTSIKQAARSINGVSKKLTQCIELTTVESRHSMFTDVLDHLDQLKEDTEVAIETIDHRLRHLDEHLQMSTRLLQSIEIARVLHAKEYQKSKIEADLAPILDQLDGDIQRDLHKLSLQPVQPVELRDILYRIKQETKSLLAEKQRLTVELDDHNNVDKNIHKLWTLLQDDIFSDALSDKISDSEINISELRHLVEAWLEILDAVELREEITRIEADIKGRGSVEKSVERVEVAQREATSQAIQVLNASWLKSLYGLDSDKINQIHDYASLIQEISETYNKDKYVRVMRLQENRTNELLAAFPVWAITNLSIASNLPLSPELFDLVIIDEASQCDVPSALPLIYRAKQVVVIGDAMQLRHIATLTGESHQILAAQYNVATEAYSYTRKSLFDLASRSVGQHPGVMMLREHYRSHNQIISFSNQAFYKNNLVIKTNMSNRDIPAKLRENAVGIFWLNVPGKTVHPSGGSAFNPEEIAVIQQMLPHIHEKFHQLEWDASFGIVTPYREQRSRIQTWLEEQSIQHELTIGTAHTFQGDERDILFFSSVLAPGMSDGSLGWLKRTHNLLNVAITRARNTLIIVGNYEFCRKLDSDNPYRQLADYVGEYPDAVYESWEDLPIANI